MVLWAETEVLVVLEPAGEMCGVGQEEMFVVLNPARGSVSGIGPARGRVCGDGSDCYY